MCPRSSSLSILLTATRSWLIFKENGFIFEPLSYPRLLTTSQYCICEQRPLLLVQCRRDFGVHAHDWDELSAFVMRSNSAPSLARRTVSTCGGCIFMSARRSGQWDKPRDDFGNAKSEDPFAVSDSPFQVLFAPTLCSPCTAITSTRCSSKVGIHNMSSVASQPEILHAARVNPTSASQRCVAQRTSVSLTHCLGTSLRSHVTLTLAPRKHCVLLIRLSVCVQQAPSAGRWTFNVC